MEFVNYEISKKLKEKKFNEPCYGYYHLDKGDDSFEVCGNGDYDFFNNINYWRIGAPRIAQALKWLRVVKGIDVLPQRGHINIDNNGKVTRYYNVNIYFERRFACMLDNDEQDYSTYEQAALAGIEYVLDNLI